MLLLLLLLLLLLGNLIVPVANDDLRTAIAHFKYVLHFYASSSVLRLASK